MALTKTGRALLKTAAKRLRDQQEKIERLKRERKKEALVDEVMDLLRERDQVTKFSADEKRAALEEKDIGELEQAKEMFEDFVRSGQYKIGQVEDQSQQHSDPIMKLLFD